MTVKSWRQCPFAVLLLVVALGSICLGQESTDKEELKSVVTAPPNSRELGSTLGGAYFVDETILQRYEAIKIRLKQVRDDISNGNASSDTAMKSLAAIEEESRLLRAELEKKKVLVSAFQVFSKTSEQVFSLGDEQLVIVTGDNVTIRGWDGPGLKCVVEKIIVAKQQPDVSEFDAIQVNHKLTIAEEKVGLTEEERDRQETEFLESETGRKLTDVQKANRKRFVDEIHHSYDDYQAFQGREANTIQLTGLTYQEGNRSLSLQIKSPKGGAAHSSRWQRHAYMTVYVPTCKSLAVRGCLVGLDIKDVECDLVLTTSDSRDRDYEGKFAVSSVKGNVTIDQVPIRILSNVTGDVRFIATDEFVNSGTHHENDMRSFSTYGTHLTQIDHVGGNLQAVFLRTELKLHKIKGILDVVNHYGSTQLTVDTVDSDRAHRIVSESGNVTVYGPTSVLDKTPIYAHTQCGRLHTDISQHILDDTSFSTGQPKKSWHGFVTPSKERFDISRFERPAAALNNSQRAAGLDLISHAGMVSILTVKARE